MYFPQQLYYSSIILALETRLTENGIPPEPNLCWGKLNTSD